MTDSSLSTLLSQLKERRAQTFPDKLKSLDLRDEIWRKYVETNKVSSNEAQRTGLCLDMCCERERITREYQRLYKSYEVDPETRALNPSLMVTEYSRAAADQAMTSPYDLRPGSVLLRTTNYLITNIMDKFDQGREQGDWYNFLWDRLRAIRKELTQQHLRDEMAIEVLERCTRFHIFCSAFLSEYPRDAFDPKLNDKMLIGCLDQLHECYITHKQSNNQSALKNLAEFTSYMLLINLREDNETLLRIRRLIEDLTEEPELQVALNIQRALLMNNTTKFFSLIEKKATLLQSCLLHRYFNIIRLKRLNGLIITSSRANDEVRLNELTNLFGLDNDDETKEYLEQFGYSISTTAPPCFLVPSSVNPDPPTIAVKLSQKLINSKYKQNLKDIISREENAPVLLADVHIENSFDLDGSFIGKLPVPFDFQIPSIPRRVVPPEPTTILPIRPVVVLPRPPSQSAMRSVAATTTANTFFLRNPQVSTQNLFTSATKTTPTPSLFGSFLNQPTRPAANPTFGFSFAPTATPVLPAPPRLVTPAAPPPAPRPATPPAPVVKRRLSEKSMEIFLDEIFESLLDPLIRQTTDEIYEDLVTRWNDRIGQTCRIFDEILCEEIFSIVEDFCSERDFHQRMIDETRRERNERQRKKYLEKKFFSIWFEKTFEAQEERRILNEFQTKYRFGTTEQFLEFLTGLQLISEHSFSVEKTNEILKYRRILKLNRQRELLLRANRFFDEFLHEEFRSLVVESNDELRQREILLNNALKRQNHRQREHFLRQKFFSIWLTKHREKKRKTTTTTTNKRLFPSVRIRTSKKFKDQHEQYQTLKNSFEQLSDDLKQIQSFVDRLIS